MILFAKPINRQTLVRQTDCLRPRRFDKLPIARDIAFRIIEKHEVEFIVRVAPQLHQQIFNELRPRLATITHISPESFRF